MVQRVTSIIDSDGHTIADWKGMMKFTPEACAKTIGAPVKLTGFIRYALGEGIEKQQTDFAAEVAATVR